MKFHLKKRKAGREERKRKMSNSDLILNPEQKYVVPFFFENIVTIYVSLFGMAMLSER